MKRAILGADAMGMLFGGRLSRENEVVLIDVDWAKVEAIGKEGIRIHEPDGSFDDCHPAAALSADNIGETRKDKEYTIVGHKVEPFPEKFVKPDIKDRF